MKFLPSALGRNRHRAWRPRPESPATLIGRLVRERRAAAPIELALGVVAILAVAAVAFDVYSLTRAHAAGERIAAIMANYVSQEATPDGGEITALGKFLHESELRVPSSLVYLISAVHKPPGDDPAGQLWAPSSYEIRLGGDDDETASLVQACKSRGQSGWQVQAIGADATLALQPTDVVIVVEVCASLNREGMLSELVAGNLYRVHALLARGTGGKPARPTEPSTSEEAAVSAGDRTRSMAFLHAPSEPVDQRAAVQPGMRAVMKEAA